MAETAFHHFQVTVTDLEKSRAFYGGFLGLPELKRPAFPFPGAWFQLSGGQELHIVCVPDPVWRGPQVMDIITSRSASAVSGTPWKSCTPPGITKSYLTTIR